jgi:hypothetical protein
MEASGEVELTDLVGPGDGQVRREERFDAELLGLTPFGDCHDD